MKIQELTGLVLELIELLEVPELAMKIDDELRSITVYCYNEEKLGDMIRRLNMKIEEIAGHEELKTSVYKTKGKVSDDKD